MRLENAAAFASPMHHDSHYDTAAARVRSLHGRPQVIRPEDLVWPPPIEDLQAFSVIKVGQDDERAASMLIVAGLVAPAHPQPKAPAPPPVRTAPPSRTAVRPPAKPVAQRVVAKPRHAVRPRVAVQPHAPNVSWRFPLPRWVWVGLVFAAALALGF